MSRILLAPQPLLDLRQVVALLAVEVEEPCRADITLRLGQVPLAEVDPPQRIPERSGAGDRGRIFESEVAETQVTKAGGRRFGRRAGIQACGRARHNLHRGRVRDGRPHWWGRAAG